MASTYAPRHVRWPHVGVSLTAIVVLAAALVGLGSWVLIDRGGDGSSATRDATTLVDNVLASWSSYDTAAVRSLYTKDAVLIHTTGERTVGLHEIAALVPRVKALGYQFERVAPVTANGDLAATFVHVSAGTWLMVFQLKDGKIVRQWHLSPGLTAPLNNAVLP